MQNTQRTNIFPISENWLLEGFLNNLVAIGFKNKMLKKHKSALNKNCCRNINKC